MLVFVHFVLFAQETVKFTDSNNSWSEATSYPNGSFEFPNFVETVTNVYGYIGDTLIDGYVWEKLYKTRNENFATGHMFVAFIREENNLVFYKRLNQPADTLYDFNFEIGDKIEYPSDFLPIVLTVEEIDSIEIGGVFHKRISFDEPFAMFSFEEVWIEGIGSIHGPVNPFDCMTFTSELPYDKDLTCFENDPVYYWSNPDYSQCYLSIILSSSSIITDNGFKIYPNPAQNFLTIESNNPFQAASEMNLMDMSGKTLLSEPLLLSGGNIFNLNSIEPGVYIFRIVNREKTAYFKIVKTL
jgi:hypothetical protein